MNYFAILIFGLLKTRVDDPEVINDSGMDVMTDDVDMFDEIEADDTFHVVDEPVEGRVLKNSVS